MSRPKARFVACGVAFVIAVAVLFTGDCGAGVSFNSSREDGISFTNEQAVNPTIKSVIRVI